MPKLDIKELYLKNFRSYGDYDTKIKLENIGPVFIVGEVVTENDTKTKSNGSGKSTLADSIIWCLFGRLPDHPTPGNWIIHRKNNEIKNKCVVQITTNDGYTITRTRDTDNSSDLLIHEPDGTDISDSITKNAQKHLNKLFNLDFEIFTSGVFFAQSGKPFLELSDIKRKKALERLLNLTKFDIYSTVAKEKLTITEKVLNDLIIQKTNLDSEIMRTSMMIENYFKQLDEWNINQKSKITSLLEKIEITKVEFDEKITTTTKLLDKEQTELNSIKSYDISYLKSRWESYNSESTRINDIINIINKFKNEINILNSEKETLETQKAIINDDQIKSVKIKISQSKQQLQKLTLFNFENLQKEHIEYELLNTKTLKLNNDISAINQEILKITLECNMIDQEINDVNSKGGTICQECKQVINKNHTHELSLNIKDKKLPKETKLLKFNDLLKTYKSDLDSHIKLVLESKPKTTMKEAQIHNENYDLQLRHISSLEETLKQYEIEQNNNAKSLIDRKNRISEIIKMVDVKNAVIIKKTAEVAKAQVANKAPEIRIEEASSLNKVYDSKEKSVQQLKNRISEYSNDKIKTIKDVQSDISNIENEANPIYNIIETTKLQLQAIKEQQNALDKKIKHSDGVVKHLTYIWRSYSDRKKIKSFVISNLIPYLNERIAYFLASLECNFNIEFNSALQTQSDKWPYELWSGGEKRRIDLAIMFAIHDLHNNIYGRQCNILVFDEYDRSLDIDGVYAFVNLLFKDFTNCGLNILVISHNEEMQDMFPTKILVKKNNDESVIEEIR